MLSTMVLRRAAILVKKISISSTAIASALYPYHYLGAAVGSAADRRTAGGNRSTLPMTPEGQQPCWRT